MDISLSSLIVYREREDLQMTFPKHFMDAFGLNTDVISYEVFIDRPNLLARAQIFSKIQAP